MSKMSELSQVLDELISCGEKLIQLAKAIRECFTPDTAIEETRPVVEAKPVAKAEIPAPPSYSKEDIRGMLAAKASEENGRYKSDVKAIVKKYGNGGTLTDIPAESYPELVKELEGLSDG